MRGKKKKVRSEKMSDIRTFRDLLVWQKSKALVKNIYALSKGFPKEENYGLTSQMRRCAVSVPSNIAEGYGRRSNLDFLRFLRIACGSLYELETQVEIAMDLAYLDGRSYETAIADTNEIERMLSSFIRKLEENKKREVRSEK